MNTSKLIILLLFLSSSIFAQETALFRIIENGKIGFINNKGETVIQAVYLEAGAFREGLASVRIGGRYGFINTTGEVAIPVKYDYVGDFKNGIVDVYVDGEVTFINKEEERVLPKIFESIRFVGKNICVFTTKKEQSGLYDISTSSFVMKAEKVKIGIFNEGLAVVTRDGADYSMEYGVMDMKGNLTLDYGEYDKVEKFVDAATLAERNKMNEGEKFKNGLLKTIREGKLTYLNEADEIVWQEKVEENGERDNRVNITHLKRGYFYAYSDPQKIGATYNGWSVSSNVPKRLSKKRSKKGLVLEEESNKLYVKNYSKKAINFEAQDSRLYMKLQAKNKKGEWQDIEYLPGSWCGNSYHSVDLSPKAYWEFDLPIYTGEFETSIRAELSYVNPETNKEEFIYSNEFSGSVNPGQFWRKPEYAVRGIMDPYID